MSTPPALARNALGRNAQGKIRTSGVWDPTERGLFFQSAQVADMALGVLDVSTSILVDAHELHPGKHGATVAGALLGGRRVLIDSGVHNFAYDLLRTQGMEWPDIFRADPDTLPGYDRFAQRHEAVLRAFADRVWGVVEVDLGSLDAQQHRRDALAAEGLVCIPVWHTDDPLDVLDRLASTYDRVGLGGIQAHTREGHQLLAALWEHCHARYPDVWFHLLGYTVNPYLLAYPLARSCDSSNWTSAMQWRGYYPRLDLQFFGTMPRGYRAITGAPTHPGGRRAVGRLSLWGAEMNGRNWQAHMASMDEALELADE